MVVNRKLLHFYMAIIQWLLLKVDATNISRMTSAAAFGLQLNIRNLFQFTTT